MFLVAGPGYANSIGDFVWEDANTNGIQDVGEVGIPAIPVRLFDPASNFVALTGTDANGFYEFTNIVAGTYFIQFLPGSTFPYYITTNNAGANDNIDSDITPDGLSPHFVYTPGVNVTNIDAGYVQYQPDVGITKIASDGTRVAADGEILYITNSTTVTYTYTITNSGNAYLSFVFLNDDVLFPFGLFPNPLLVACPDNFPPGDVLTYTTQVVVNASVTNVATVEAVPVDFKYCTPLLLDPVRDSNDAVVVISNPGISLTKEWTSPTNRPAAIGENLQFVITAVNTGNVPLATVPLEDTYDTNFLAYVSSVPASGDNANDGIINWTNIAGPMAVGSTATVFVTFTGLDATTGFETNTVVVSPTTTTNYPGDVPPVTNTAPYDIVDPVVTILKTLVNPSGRPAAVGETNIFQILVTNSGDYNLDTVPVEDTYDTSLLSYLYSTPISDNNTDDGIINWANVGPLAPGASTVITSRFRAVASGIGTNFVTTAPTTTNNVPVPPDDDPEGYTNVNPTVSIVKTLISPSGRPAAVGETNVFTLVVENTGDITLDTVPVVDTYNTGLLTYQDATPVSVDNNNDGMINWTDVGPLTVGQTTSITVRFVAAASGIGTNFAQVSPTTTNGIPVPPDDDPEGFTNVNPVVVITKTLVTPSGRPAAIGETNIFQIVVTNAGDVVLDTVPMEDTYDTTLISYLGANPVSDDNNDDGTINWADLGSLDIGGSITITTRFIVVTNGVGTNLVSTAPTTTNGIPVPPDEDPEGYTNVNPRVEIVKTLVHPPRSGIVGETNAFRITVSNVGDITLDTVYVEDVYDVTQLNDIGSIPPADDGGPGGFAWTNVGPLAVGQSVVLTSYFEIVSTGIGTNFVFVEPTTTNGIPVPPDDDPEGYTNVMISIGDTVWIDLDTDSTPDENLALYGLNGVTVNLFRVSGGVTTLVSSATTASAFGQQGYYEFSGLPYGVYVSAIDLYSVPPLLTAQTTPTSYVIDPDAPGFPSDGVVDTADFGLQSGSFTPIELESFTAERSDTGVRLDWATAVEFESLGFNLYRAATASDKVRTKLTSTLIPAVGGQDGAAYSFTDSSASDAASYLYWLEEVANDGSTELFGPVAVHADIDGINLATATLGSGGLIRIDYESLVTAGVAVNDIDPAKLKVFIGGKEVAAYVSTDATLLQPGDYVLFYAQPSVGERNVLLTSADEEAVGMDWIYARPARRGDLGVVAADESGITEFEVNETAARMMISGFTDPTIWVLDTTDPQQPSILYGQVVVQGDSSGEYAVYFSVNPEEVSNGIAVQDDSIIDLKEIRSE